MTKRIFITVMILCASFTSYAQVEKEAKKIAEAQHKLFASELSEALKSGKGRPIFGSEGKDEQFLLEDDPQIFSDYLGWSKSLFDKRTLLSVYRSLLSETKQKDAKKKVSVKITFPLNEVEFKGESTNKSGKTIKNLYLVTTTAEATVEASKQGLEKSIAKNTLILSWDVLVNVNNKSGDVDTRNSRALLKSITVEQASGFFTTEKQKIQNVAETLIKDYYQSLRNARWSSVEIPDEWKSPLQSSVKRETEGDVVVALPASKSFDVRTVPDLKIYVNNEAYYKVALGFSIAINDDLKSGKITSVKYTELEKPRIVEPEPESEPEPIVVYEAKPEPVIEAKPEPVKIAQPVVRERGITYKVQILSLTKYVAIADLPHQFRMDQLTVEKYNVGGVIYYKYVIPVGSLNEALAIRRKMNNNGIEVWIPIYENGARIAPNEGMPELIR